MSIPHFEDLPPNKFLEIMKHFWEYEATEKLDGSQLLFGIDENGFYTSRETKGGMRIYNVNHYELSFKNTYIRSAHIALESVLPLLKDAGLTIGCQVEVEVLYGEFPNVVQYSSDRSFIIFLRTTEGDVNIDNMRVQLEGQSLSISLIAPFTINSKDIDYRMIVNTWQFERSPIINVNNGILIEMQDCIISIGEYLSSLRKLQDYKINNLQLLETKLNRKPEWLKDNWKEQKSEISMQRKIEFDIYAKNIAPLKKFLLDKIVRGRPSKFGPQNGWIEGVVFRHRITGDMFKLVDKEIFLKIKDFYWQERNLLFKLEKIGYNSIDLDHRLDKYEKDRSTYELIIHDHRFIYGPIIDSRTKEIFATLYQKEKDR